MHGHTAAAAERLAGAIRHRTISSADPDQLDGSAFTGLHAYLMASYPRTARELIWETVLDYSLMLTWKGRCGSKPMALLAHLDVVPVAAGTEGDWTHGPFDGDIDGGYVWGRGALDMKGHMICVLEAVEALLEQGYKPESDIFLCFGHNEEIVSVGGSGAAAMAELLRSRGVRLDMVLDEGGFVMPGEQLLGMDSNVATVGTAEKGYMDVRLACVQQGGHSSQPPASTALGILARAVARLERHPAKPRLTGTVKAMLASAGKRIGGMKSFAMANPWLFGPFILRSLMRKPMTNALVRTTRAATMASASPAPNVLPQTAEIIVNVRLLPGETIEGELARMRRIIADSRVTVELGKGQHPSAESPVDTDGFRLIREVLEGLYPSVTVAPFLMIGSTDSYQYQPVCDNIYRIAPFLMTSEDMKGVHGTDERISVSNLALGSEFFKRILLRC